MKDMMHIEAWFMYNDVPQICTVDYWIGKPYANDSDAGNFAASVGYDLIEDYCEDQKIPFPNKEAHFDWWYWESEKPDWGYERP